MNTVNLHHQWRHWRRAHISTMIFGPVNVSHYVYGLAVPLEWNPAPCLVTDVQPADPASPWLPWVRFESYPGIRCFLTTEYIPSHSDAAERARSQTSGDPAWWGKEAKVTVRNNVCFISSTPLNFRVGNNIESVGKYNIVNLNWIVFWSSSVVISHMDLVCCTALKQWFDSFSCLETTFKNL